jgi:hypothetical protein
MRTAICFAAALVILVPPGTVADPPKPNVMLRSGLISAGIPLPESTHRVYSISLDATVNAKGEGRGTLTLHVTPPNYDEYGDFVTGRETDNVDRKGPDPVPAVALECKIELIKKGFVGRVNEPGVERVVYSIEGPKVRSTLLFATTGPGLTSGRLLVHGKKERVEFVVEMAEWKPVKVDPNIPQVPCHPGCFPAGTIVLIPGGSKPIDEVHVGDILTSVGKDGVASQATVEKLFTTKNNLFEVRTDRVNVLTTDAQPLCLSDGQFRKAGDLKAGDRVWQWRDGKRIEAVVKSVTAAGRQENVFNLILDDSKMFVAGGFLVRGKPPTDAATTAGATNPGHSIGHGKE